MKAVQRVHSTTSAEGNHKHVSGFKPNNTVLSVKDRRERLEFSPSRGRPDTSDGETLFDVKNGEKVHAVSNKEQKARMTDFDTKQKHRNESKNLGSTSSRDRRGIGEQSCAMDITRCRRSRRSELSRKPNVKNIQQCQMKSVPNQSPSMESLQRDSVEVNQLDVDGSIGFRLVVNPVISVKACCSCCGGYPATPTGVSSSVGNSDDVTAAKECCVPHVSVRQCDEFSSQDNDTVTSRLCELTPGCQHCVQCHVQTVFSRQSCHAENCSSSEVNITSRNTYGNDDSNNVREWPLLNDKSLENVHLKAVNRTERDDQMENLSKTNQNVHFRVLNGTSEDSHPENLNEMNKNGDLKTLNNAAEDGYLENLNKMNKNVQREARHHQDRNASLVTSLRSFLRSYSRLNGSLAKTSMTAVLAVLTLLQLLPWTAAVVYQKQLSSRVITTRYGKVRGILVEFPNRHLNPVEAYFGLKYADLEKGNMRFMPPKNPKEQWTKIRAAVLQQPACPQLMRHEREYQDVQPENRVSHLRNITAYLTKQQEDCLSLNLYVPMPKWNETTAMPVMVFIHGETYDSGTGNAYDGSVLSSFGDVIVVTLNYRLGVLGFLTTLDHSAMANLGLLDITQALLWLQENVASFNGDPKRVTLFGHGHGAALVNLLLLSPFMSEGRGPFFQQAIVQSGSALSNWAVSYDPLWCTEKLANKVNCTSFIGNNDELVKCLRKRSVAELLNAAPDAPKYYSCFAPAVDEWTVLPTQVEKLIKERNSKFASVPVMFGITKNEAYSYLKQQEIHKGISDFRKTQIIRTYVQNVFRYHRQKVYEILDHQYTDWTQPSTHMSNRDNILELLSDGQYVAPLIKTANYHSETADTYLYSFSYSTQSEASAPDSEEEIQGIHGDELPYVFGSPLVDGLSPFPSSYTNVEKMMSEAVMTYWTNFAKTGNPNLPRNQTSVHGDKVHNRFEGLKWPKYDVTTQQYLQIGRRPAVKHHYRGQKLAMWLDLIPKINVPDGSDPSAHMLAYANNHTTFDDYHRLIRPFDNIFPSPPPMPPISPTLSYTNDEPSTPTATPHMGGGKYPKPDLPPDDTTAPDVDVTTTTVEPMTKPLPPGAKVTDTREHLTSSLSITVAVGCTLLFLNILIFAAVYYQRVRIRKLRERGEPEDPDEVRLNRKLEREANHRNCVTGPETDSLMSGGTGGVGGGSGSGRGGEEDYPTTDLGMGGGAGTTGTLNSQGTLGRRSPPQNGRKTPSGTLSRSSTLDTASSCNYAPVPTHNTSPLHRPQVHYPQPHPHPHPHNSTSALPPYPGTHAPVAMNTFGNNVNSLGKGSRLGGGYHPRGGPGMSEAADTGLYSVINKAPLAGREGGSSGTGTGGSSANNAITIV